MSHQNPSSNLPLFQQGVGVPPPRTERHGVDRFGNPWTEIQTNARFNTLTPTARGEAEAADAAQHLTDEAPGWLLDALGDALLAFQGGDFTSEMVRSRAEESEAVKGWLDGPTRNACFSGWWRNAVRRYRLVRVNRAPAIAKRSSRRGATIPWWKWPV